MRHVGRLAEPEPGDGDGLGCRVERSGDGARMIGMAVREHGALDRSRGVEEEVEIGEVEAFGSCFDAHRLRSVLLGGLVVRVIVIVMVVTVAVMVVVVLVLVVLGIGRIERQVE